MLWSYLGHDGSPSDTCIEIPVSNTVKALDVHTFENANDILLAGQIGVHVNGTATILVSKGFRIEMHS